MATQLTSTTGYSGVLPHEYSGELLVTALREQALCLSPQVVTMHNTAQHTVHFPALDGDASGAFVAEGSEIGETAPTMREIQVTPTKAGNLTIVSRELAEDSSPDSATIVGQSLAQGLANTLDTSFFAASTTNGPAGLGSLTVNEIDAGSAWANLDVFADAMSNAEARGTNVTAFIGSYEDVAALSKLKSGTNYNTPLLGMDPTKPGTRTIFGVPVIASSHATDGAMWAMCNERVVTVLRQDSRIDVSQDAYFSSDRIALRGTVRVGYAFLSPMALSKISLSE